MRAGAQLFGQHLPTGSWVHRLGIGTKYALVLLPSLASLVVRQWWLALALVALGAGLLLASRIPARWSLRLPWYFVVMAVLVSLYGFIAVSWQAGTTTLANIIGALLVSRVLTMTTPAADLVDALVGVARPLDRFVPQASERFGLAVALMLRSIPHLVDSFGQVRQAARARGLQRRVAGLLTPVVIMAVAHAQRSGEALTARGLGDPDDRIER
ncbi:energy-coupling factor transporter transmembrane component T family protein [Aestuariimicrobium ganziense]|uniref:energy-coupling factor transporter transmembrane component T family protein n=1 Tax=Aestuariimicrobium ganziense TaxID=2773677 RepID=UPI0019420FA5|nr:energy-coupling factor transporter transmembrane protein EcfT [Aestuariimicrobium ganziense]